MRSSPYLDSLTPDKIDEVLDDLKLIQAGYKIHFAVDPHEIFDFCFPIDPEHFRKRDLDAIADDQAALHHIFYAPKTPPILLDTYVKEIRGLMMSFEYAIDEAYNETEMVNKLINEVGLGTISDSHALIDSEILKIIQEKFSIILAVAMGIYSLGVERFREICDKLLFKGGLVSNNPILFECFQTYNQSDSLQYIFRELLKSHNRPAIDKSEAERRKRNSFVDATAIDQILYVNDILQNESLEREDKSRHIILYLSSASRIEKIFKQESIVSRLPFINNKRFPILRDRTQIFAYVVHKSKDDDLDKSIENLENVKKLLLDINKLERSAPSDSESCSTCILDGGIPNDCPLEQTCSNVKLMYGPIKERRREIRNLGLTKALDAYQHLLTAPTRNKPQEKIMDFFRLVNKDNIRDLARERMLEKQRLIFMQSMTTAMWSNSRQFAENHLREGRDTIVGTIQYLPLKPKIENESYTEILSLILNYYKTPPQGGRLKLDAIDKAYKLYFEIDAKTKDLDPEHELVRCLLYLAFPSQKGDSRAFEHGAEMLNLKKLIEQKPYIEREYNYLLCWAGRRLKEFQKADELANSAIVKWPDDARFYHARSLAKLAWWEQNPEEADPELLHNAIADAEVAITFYGQDMEENRELIGVNYNNLAYLYTLLTLNKSMSVEGGLEFLNQARKALINLKDLIKRDDWRPNHPEYFHTEALLEYQEFLFNEHKLTKKDLIDKLENARGQIIQAVELNNIPLYSELKFIIENALHLLRSEDHI